MRATPLSDLARRFDDMVLRAAGYLPERPMTKRELLIAAKAVADDFEKYKNKEPEK